MPTLVPTASQPHTRCPSCHGTFPRGLLPFTFPSQPPVLPGTREDLGLSSSASGKPPQSSGSGEESRPRHSRCFQTLCSAPPHLRVERPRLRLRRASVNIRRPRPFTRSEQFHNQTAKGREDGAAERRGLDSNPQPRATTNSPAAEQRGPSSHPGVSADGMNIAQTDTGSGRSPQPFQPALPAAPRAPRPRSGAGSRAGPRARGPHSPGPRPPSHAVAGGT